MNSSRATRFCSCSEAPGHLSGTDGEFLQRETTDELIEEQQESREPELAMEDASPMHQSRFCSCSDIPRTLHREPDEAIDLPIDQPEPAPEPATDTTTSDATPLGVPESPDLEGETVDSSTQTSNEWPELKSASDLLPGESLVYSAQTHGDGSSEALLTDRRVVLRGAPDAVALFASLRLQEIESVTISRARPNRRSLIWGLIGIGAAIGMWQALDGVGNMRAIVAGVVVLMSLVLLGDYALRPTDVEVTIRANSGSMMSILFSHSRSSDADKFAAHVLSAVEANRFAGRQRHPE